MCSRTEPLPATVCWALPPQTAPCNNKHGKHDGPQVLANWRSGRRAPDEVHAVGERLHTRPLGTHIVNADLGVGHTAAGRQSSRAT